MKKKIDKGFEYRMYSLINYQFNSIHGGIQTLHAVVDYSRSVIGTKHEKAYIKWADKDKTVIILNGGTTNKEPNRLGTLNNHLTMLIRNCIYVSTFQEPDLGDQLTAIVFLVDERVFNKERYPDFIEINEESDIKQRKRYENWVKLVGGSTNVFLRDFLKPLRLV